METLQSDVDASVNEPMFDRAGIARDLGVSTRTTRDYSARGILPPPDANLLGRDLWRQSTYLKFKKSLIAGRFSRKRLLPHQQPTAASA